MARTKQTARVFVGGKAPRQQAGGRARRGAPQTNPLAQNLPLAYLPPKQIVYQPSGRNDSPINTIHEKYDDDDLLVDKPAADKMIEEGNNQENVADHIHLTLKLKNKFLQVNSASAQTYPMLVSLSVDDLKVSNRANVDLICVLDTSGSMAGEKLQLLIQTLEFLLTLLSDNDRICLITFDNTAKRLSRLIRMTEKGKNDALKIIKGLQANGGTHIASGIDMALHVIKDRRTKNQVTGVFLLSDGQDNVSGVESRVEKLLWTSQIEDIFTISCFGYGNDHVPDVMTQISGYKDGAFYYISKYEQLEECFVDCVGGLISVVAEDVKLQIKAEPSEIFPDVKIVKCYGRDQWIENEAGKVYSIEFEQIISGKQNDYVLLVEIPPTTRSLLDQEKQIKIASAKCDMKLTLNDSKEVLVKNAEVSAMFMNEDEEFKADEADKDVMINYYRVRAADTISEARTLADLTKYEEAKIQLTDLKEELANSPFKQEPLIEKLIENFEVLLVEIEPKRYLQTGRHQVCESEYVHLQGKGGAGVGKQYKNKIQREMLASRKGKKK